jgi:membrane-bound metal-dependent hydrolase YbcI (DUF457 family)
MMGKSHAASGWCVGLATAPLMGLTAAPAVVMFATVVAGYTLVPDGDHPQSRVSRFLGPFTGALSWLLRHASAGLYAVTKGPRDEDGKGTHRHASHTLLFAVVLGVAVAIMTRAWGPWASFTVLLIGVLLAADALGDWILAVAVAAGGFMVVTTDVMSALAAVGGWLGIAVALGCFVHCLGDSITKSGCPFLFPLPIAGETWYEIRPPRWLRFSTNKKVEKKVVFPVFAVLGVVLLPGVLPLLVDVWVNVSSNREDG